MGYNVKPEQEMSFESTLIPEGTLVKCVIEKSEGPKEGAQKNGNWMYNWELKVSEGIYKGSKLFDNVGTAGSPGFVTMGKMKMSYALEMTNNAAVTGNYEIEPNHNWVGSYVLVKVGVETYQNKDGRWGYKNVTRAYGSPRKDSRNHQIYADYNDGLQPYQTDALPPLPSTPANNNGGHPALASASEIGF